MNKLYIPDLQFNVDYGCHQVDARTGCFCRFDASCLTNHPHRHDCYEVCIVLEGNGEFIHGQDHYQLEVGDLFVADPQVTHEINSFRTQDLLLYFFMMAIERRPLPLSERREDLTLESFLSGHAILTRKCFHLNSYVEFLKSYHQRRGTHNFWSRRIVENLMFESFESLSMLKVRETAGMTPPVESDVVETAIRFIQSNLNRKITLTEIATHCCTCERNLQLLFQCHLRTTPLRFMNEKRAVAAAGYLLQGYRVAAAGSMIGIIEPSQFSRFFKQYFHCTPKAYQQQYLPHGMKFSSRHLECNK